MSFKDFELTDDYKISARLVLDFQWKDRMVALKRAFYITEAEDSQVIQATRMILEAIPCTGADAIAKKDRIDFLHVLSLGYKDIYGVLKREVKKCNIMWAIEYIFNKWDEIPESFKQTWLEANYYDEEEVFESYYKMCDTCLCRIRDENNFVKEWENGCGATYRCYKCRQIKPVPKEEEKVEEHEEDEDCSCYMCKPSKTFTKWAMAMSRDEVIEELLKKGKGYDRELLNEEKDADLIAYLWEEQTEKERAEWWEE